MNLRVKIKRLKDVELPKYAREFDAGFDLVAAEDVIINPGETKVIPTGLAFEIPPGNEMQIRPRSGISAKTRLRVVLGTVDSGYRSEVGIIVNNISFDTWSNAARNIDNSYVEETRNKCEPGSYIIRKGDRLAQGVIAPVVTANFVEVDKLSESDRDSSGFGSTGVK
jgi:dUTP pyrophosphatase